MDRNGKKSKARPSGADTNTQRSDLKSQNQDVLGRDAADPAAQRERARGGNFGKSPKGRAPSR